QGKDGEQGRTQVGAEPQVRGVLGARQPGQDGKVQLGGDASALGGPGYRLVAATPLGVRSVVRHDPSETTRQMVYSANQVMRSAAATSRISKKMTTRSF